MISFKEYSFACCDECDDDIHGIVEDIFVIEDNEEYEDWGEDLEEMATHKIAVTFSRPNRLGKETQIVRVAAKDRKNAGIVAAKHFMNRNLQVHNVSHAGLSEEKARQVKLNKPFLTPGGPKKRAVYVKHPETGNVVKVSFGDPNLSIKRDDPERRRSFRARHNCENPGPKHKARYWSCKYWSTTPVSKLD